MSDFLSMSDADFLAQGPAKLAVAQAAPEAPNVEQPADASATEIPVPGADVQQEQNPDADLDAAGGEINAEAETPGSGESETPGESGENPGGEVDEDERVDDPGAPAVTEAEQPAAELPEGASRIFETFRANGRDMKVKSVDEAIRLMQMGANYSQKNANDKKTRGFVKVLEKNNLLDHEKLAFAVDLLAGKPEAIGKLIKDAKVDVHDLDDAAVAAYRAESQAPSETSLDLDAVIEEVQGTAHFDRLVADMRNWDQKSQALVGNHPESLKQLTQQVENGVYDKIMDEVHRQQVLGNLTGVPLMQAYNQIGQEMAQAGAFSKPAPTGPVKKLVTPGKTSKPSKADEERRRAAAPSKGASTASEEVKKPNFLAMSDEDFLKQMKP